MFILWSQTFATLPWEDHINLMQHQLITFELLFINVPLGVLWPSKSAHLYNVLLLCLAQKMLPKAKLTIMMVRRYVKTLDCCPPTIKIALNQKKKQWSILSCWHNPKCLHLIRHFVSMQIVYQFNVLLTLIYGAISWPGLPHWWRNDPTVPVYLTILTAVRHNLDIFKTLHFSI